jgi:predicted phosphodiesterase
VTRVARRTLLKGLLATGVGAATGASAYGYLYARHQLSVTREAVTVAGLPLSLAGLRIGLLTDIHRSRWVSHEDVAHAVAALMAERPDVVVLGGDYVTQADRRYMGPAADALAPLTAPHGVFGILGNHDDDQAMPAALAKNGVTVLKDARTRLTINGEGLDVAGIRYWTRRPADIAALVRDATAPVILLAHDPAVRGRAPEHPSRALRAHARRAGRPPGPRRDRGPALSRHRWRRAPRQDDDVRQPRARNRLCAHPAQLPARSRRVDVATGLDGMNARQKIFRCPRRAH